MASFTSEGRMPAKLIVDGHEYLVDLVSITHTEDYEEPEASYEKGIGLFRHGLVTRTFICEQKMWERI